MFLEKFNYGRRTWFLGMGTVGAESGMVTLRVELWCYKFLGQRLILF